MKNAVRIAIFTMIFLSLFTEYVSARSPFAELIEQLTNIFRRSPNSPPPIKPGEVIPNTVPHHEVPISERTLDTPEIHLEGFESASSLKSMNELDGIIRESIISEKVEASLSLFAVVPANAKEYSQTFKKPMTAQAKLEMQQAEMSLRESVQNSSVASDNFGIEDFGAFIKTNHNSFIIVSGHNDQGKFFFPNGSTIELHVMGDICYDLDKRCIFLSCDSREYIEQQNQLSIEDVITFQQAANIAKGIQMHFDDLLDKKISYEEMYFVLGDLLRKEKIKAKLKFIVKTTASAPVIAGLYISSNGRSDK